ncbi:MAG TPA: cytochrome c [Candidatus Eisenbacteria bacterium]|nr:cytochrome c [Candidatus Eisenbacteria bacterium]
MEKKSIGLLAVGICAATLMFLATPVKAQVTQYDEDKRLDMESHVDGITGHARDGAPLYGRYCIGCHGEIGDGNGDNAPWMEPFKPRNFTLGIFKCRSTPTGTLPTDEDLYNTIGRGLNTSNMPHWIALTKQERANLVAYVKHFSPRFATEKPGTPIQIPQEPQITADRIKAGRAVFERVQCWKCHGVTGRANGPSASTLTDDFGNPDPAFNFHDETRFKCGTSDSDLYKIFMTGLDGSPMPSWSDNIKPDEAWDLVFYLRTLQPQKSKAKEIAAPLHLTPVNPNALPGGQ